MSASPVQPAPVQQNHAAPAFGREFDLLLAFCADSSTRDQEERIRAITRVPLDWRRFVDIAEHHGLIPHLSGPIASFTEAVPAEVMRSIRELYESNARRTLWLSRELIRVVKHLESQNIPSLPYKGPTLAELLYGNVTTRQFSDLDILVHTRDVARTRTALAEIGFAPAITLTPSAERAFLRSGYELAFDSPNGRNLLEIQWQILPRFYAVDFDLKGFFQRSVTRNLAGVTIHCLGVSDLLLVLCVHAAKHLWMQISWLCDIVALARSAQLDWDWVWDESEGLGIRRIVEVTFALAHRLLAAPLPPGMKSDVGTDAVVADVIPLLVKSTSFDPESLGYFRQYAKAREKPSDRRRLWWRLATTPGIGEWSAIQLPAALFPLYRVVRAGRLVRRIF